MLWRNAKASRAALGSAGPNAGYDASDYQGGQIRNECGQVETQIVAVELGTTFNPAFKESNLIFGKSVAIERHAFDRVIRDDPAKRFALLKITGDEPGHAGVTFGERTLIGIDAITALFFLRTMAGLAVLQENRRDISREADRLRLSEHQYRVRKGCCEANAPAENTK